jgi:hypothetical protein
VDLERDTAMILHEDERKKTVDELEGVKRQACQAQDQAVHMFAPEDHCVRPFVISI